MTGIVSLANDSPGYKTPNRAARLDELERWPAWEGGFVGVVRVGVEDGLSWIGVSE